MVSIYDNGTGNSYVGLVQIGTPPGEPEKIVQGSPLFWGSDGTSIYYAGDTPQPPSNYYPTYQFDLTTEQSTALKTPVAAVVGHMVGVDSILSATTSTVTLFDFDTLVTASTSIPTQDK
jgi:hypothetical protein